ncbi:DUF3280 domain-containing protein [Bosea sp. 117]|uniref:DUF3280 domain-containing protein n=1 Tax=Bosea sp. 117 TaxID=1125973 RepID=UPI00068DAFED|nr:DUF3280 domain-containing protein [Bosea sp. 117]
MSETLPPVHGRLPIRAGLVIGLALLSASPALRAAESVPTKIAVFDFELNDRSAGGGVIAEDANDRTNLKAASELARKMLEASGRYSTVDTAAAVAGIASAGGVRACNGCDSALARDLGADQSMVGLITRVNRTEYTMQIMVRDARTGAVVSNAFTGLRMGANYAWPRGVKWLMDNRLLAAPRTP